MTPIEQAIALLRKGHEIKEKRCFPHESWTWAMNEMSREVNEAYDESQTCFAKALEILEKL